MHKNKVFPVCHQGDRPCLARYFYLQEAIFCYGSVFCRNITARRKQNDYDGATECIQALQDVGFTISEGGIAGYIGPNGAGKSSTIKILSGILTPESGACMVDGRVPWKNRMKHVKNIGVVFGQRSQLWWDVPVIDSFDLLKNIYSIPMISYRQNLEELTQLLDLQELLKTAGF